jgi:hypothetical protein
MQPLVSAGGGAAGAAPESSAERERFPSASTVGGDLENGVWYSGSRGLANTEGVIGSNPAPTISL